MRPPSIREKVAFLRRPEAYPEATATVEPLETHMSWVFLTERHAYKLKKPVRGESLDLTTPERRRRNAEGEVRLNRRLAEPVYLGVVPLTCAPDGTLALEGEGEPVDWLVHMRRLPAHRMLDARIEAGGLSRSEVEPAARHLARFYARAEPVGIAPEAYRRRLEEGTHHDRRELVAPEAGLEKDRVEALAADQLRFLEARADLFDTRVAEGRIVEGHGDLRPEHICLTEEPVVIDCLEFSRELRIGDPADELAFLALECERLGCPAVGGWFLDVHRSETGDDPPEALLRFHRTFRCLRRAVIAVWHLRDDDLEEPAKWVDRARRYLELASPPAA